MDIVGNNHSLLSYLTSTGGPISHAHASGVSALTNSLLLPFELQTQQQQFNNHYYSQQKYHQQQQQQQQPQRIIHSRTTLCSCFTVRITSLPLFIYLFFSIFAVLPFSLNCLFLYFSKRIVTSGFYSGCTSD